jgi:hypothetical protein
MTALREPRKVFVLRLEGKSNNETAHTHALRRVLKVLLRSYDLRCVDAREIRADDKEPHS